MVDLYVLRHAESTWNRDNKLVWHTDVRLSEEWQRQTEMLCRYLESIELKVDRIISSDLQRAQSTIEPYSKATGVSIETDTRLREMFFWEYENRLFSDIDMRPYEADKYWFFPPWGESYHTMRPRVVEFLQKQILSRQSWSVLLSTHACVIRLLDGILCETHPQEIVKLEIPNGSMSHYQISDDWVIKIRFACDNHLYKAA